jgi:hypothetical protein
MSVTFDYVGADRSNGPPSPCLCSQAAPGWPECAADVLKSHADAGCACCAGSGMEPSSYWAGESVNVSESNIGKFLRLLGLDKNETQHITLPEARRAVIYARNRFSSIAPNLVEKPSRSRGARGALLIEMGSDQDRFKRYLDSFERLIKAAETVKSEGIVWG